MRIYESVGTGDSSSNGGMEDDRRMIAEKIARMAAIMTSKSQPSIVMSIFKGLRSHMF